MSHQDRSEPTEGPEPESRDTPAERRPAEEMSADQLEEHIRSADELHQKLSARLEAAARA
ncbi:hypothetical protein [Nesterenkonia suensis]